MAESKIINNMKIEYVSTNVTTTTNSTAFGGHYAYVSIESALISKFGSNWADKVIMTIPIGATSTTSNGDVGIIASYNKSNYSKAIFALHSNKNDTYRCDFAVFYR